MHGELVAGGLVLVDDETDPGAQAVARFVVDAWTAQLVPDDPQWAWEENTVRWHVWDLRPHISTDPFRPVRLDGVRPQHVSRYLQVHQVPPDTTVVRTPVQLDEVACANAVTAGAAGVLVAPLLVYAQAGALPR